MFSARGIEIGSKTCIIVFLGLRSDNGDKFELWFERERKKKTRGIVTCGINNLEID